MRAGALSDAKVGAYLKDHYVSTWKRVGTFTAIQSNGKTVARAGGNVAVYFCTPDLEVIDAIAGPVGKRAFLEEARWAVETYKEARRKAGDDREALVKAMKEAHNARVPQPFANGSWKVQTAPAVVLRHGAAPKAEGSAEKKEKGASATEAWVELFQVLEGTGGVVQGTQQGCEKEDALKTRSLALTALVALGGQNMHPFLGQKGMPKLEEVYRHVFERVLGERVTDKPIATMEMAKPQVLTFSLQPSGGGEETENLRVQIKELKRELQKLQKQVEELKAGQK